MELRRGARLPRLQWQRRRGSGASIAPGTRGAEGSNREALWASESAWLALCLKHLFLGVLLSLQTLLPKRQRHLFLHVASLEATVQSHPEPGGGWGRWDCVCTPTKITTRRVNRATRFEHPVDTSAADGKPRPLTKVSQPEHLSLRAALRGLITAYRSAFIQPAEQTTTQTTRTNSERFLYATFFFFWWLLMISVATKEKIFLRFHNRGRSIFISFSCASASRRVFVCERRGDL